LCLKLAVNETAIQLLMYVVWYRLNHMCARLS